MSRRKTGRPTSTGSADNIPVRFRVTDAELAALEAEAAKESKRLGREVSAHQVAKWRVFPKMRPR